MAKLVFVTGPMASGKTRWIREHADPSTRRIIDEGGFSSRTLHEIHADLEQGIDVYVSWILPEATAIEWVQP